MKPGDIHWVELPVANGREQSGRRPGIILQDDAYAGSSPLVYVVPLTTSLAVTRFAGTVFVEATKENGLAKDSVALVFQLRATDRTRIKDKIGVIKAEALIQILVEMNKLAGNSP